MIYVLSQYWIFAALAALLGLVVGWLTCASPREGRLGWLAWGLGAFVVGLVLALTQIVPGLAGHALEIALLLFAAYLLGCWLGCLLKQATGGADATALRDTGRDQGREKGRQKDKDEKIAARDARGGKTAALAGPNGGQSAAKAVGATAVAGAAAATARAARDAAKAKAKAEADAKSHAKFVEEEAVRAKAEAERLAREKAEADAKARREAELLAREEELARAGKSSPPARDFSVAKGDPLTWIGRIGPHAESKLNELGIRKFAQIAAWTPSNGRWIDERLGDPGRAAREDWVAQAQRLVRGEMTDHAKAVKAGAIQIDDAPPAKPKPDAAKTAQDGANAAGKGAGKAAAAAAPVGLAAAGAALVAGALEGGTTVVSAVAATVAGGTDVVVKGIEAAASVVETPQATAVETTVVESVAEEIVAAPPIPRYAPARPRAGAGHGGVTPGAVLPALSAPAARALVVAPAAALPVAVEPAPDAPRPTPDAGEGLSADLGDDLKWIKGVGPANERVLHDLGVRRFAQIAAWSPETAEWAERHLRVAGRIERERWIAQARLLAAGVMTDHAAAVKAGAVDLSRADALLDADEAERFAASLPQAAAPVEGEDSHEGVRPLGLAGPRGGRADDLKLIRGVGRQNEQRLHALGVWHFDQIAAWSVENVKWVGSYLAFPGRIDREDWIAQAIRLARGETTAFAERVKQGDVPTSSAD